MNNKNPDLQVQFEEEVSQLLMILEDMIDAYKCHKDLNKNMPDLIKHFNSVKTIQEERITAKIKLYQALLMQYGG